MPARFVKDGAVKSGKVSPPAGIALFLIVAVLCPLYSLDAVKFPRIEADPAIENFLKDGPYSAEELFEIALWASGGVKSGGKFIYGKGGKKPPLQAQIEEKDGLTYRDYLNFAARKLKETEPEEERARAEYILDFMHREILTGYSLNQSGIDVLLSDGTYNCVSSAVLYMILASASGLETKGVVTRDHAFITVFFKTGGSGGGGQTGEADVETTNRFGFNPGGKKEFNEGFKSTGFKYVPKTNYRDRVSVSGIELISTILQNRIKTLEDKHDYYQAVPLAIDRKRLLAGHGAAGTSVFEDPVKMADERLMNYGAQLLNSGREDAALQWAGYIAGTISDKGLLENYIYSALNNKISRLIRAGDFAGARAALELYIPKLTNGSSIKKLRGMLSEAELAELVNSAASREDAETALARISEAENYGLHNTGKAASLRNTVIINEANRVSRAGGAAAAVRWLEDSIAEYGADARLNSALKLYRGNMAGEMHNRFVSLCNKKDYEGAMTFLETALKIMPDSPLLKSDYQKLKQSGQRNTAPGPPPRSESSLPLPPAAADD